MDDPVREISDVIRRLTQGSPKIQEHAINEFFTPDASFTHPFCRTGSFDGSRRIIHAIFRWYKVMSPKIELQIHSIAYDEENLLLYVSLSQVFAVWFVPFHRSPVSLTTVLQLTRPEARGKYYISSQNDLYQTDQFVRFVAPWGIGTTLVLLWHFWATFFCVVLAYLTSPFTALMQAHIDRQGTSETEEKAEKKKAVESARHAAGSGSTNGSSNGTGTRQYGGMQVVK